VGNARRRPPLRAYVCGALAGALVAWVLPAIAEAWKYSSPLQFLEYALAFLNFAWGYVGLVVAIGARHLFPKHSPRTWGVVAILTSGTVVAASLWASVDVPFDSSSLFFQLTPSLLGIAIGAALFALPADSAPGRERPVRWLNPPALALAAAALPAAGLLYARHVFRWQSDIHQWDVAHGFYRYPLSLLLIEGYTALALVALVSKKRAFIGVIALLLGSFLLLGWVPWQLLHWIRFGVALLVADALRTRQLRTA
jgi:hypothetical protein